MKSAPQQKDLLTNRWRSAKPPPAIEFKIHAMVADVLERWGDRDWQWTHIASGEYRTAATAGRLKRMGVKKGWPDFMFISPQGFPYFLELKRAKVGKPTPEQEAFGEWCFAHGVAYATAHGFQEALQQLKGWGIVSTSVRVSV